MFRCIAHKDLYTVGKSNLEIHTKGPNEKLAQITYREKFHGIPYVLHHCVAVSSSVMRRVPQSQGLVNTALGHIYSTVQAVIKYWVMLCKENYEKLQKGCPGWKRMSRLGNRLKNYVNGEIS